MVFFGSDEGDVPVFDNHYIDFLDLLKEDGKWLIFNKMYTTLSEE